MQYLPISLLFYLRFTLQHRCYFENLELNLFPCTRAPQNEKVQEIDIEKMFLRFTKKEKKKKKKTGRKTYRIKCVSIYKSGAFVYLCMRSDVCTRTIMEEHVTVIIIQGYWKLLLSPFLVLTVDLSIEYF